MLFEIQARFPFPARTGFPNDLKCIFPDSLDNQGGEQVRSRRGAKQQGMVRRFLRLADKERELVVAALACADCKMPVRLLEAECRVTGDMCRKDIDPADLGPLQCPSCPRVHCAQCLRAADGKDAVADGDGGNPPRGADATFISLADLVRAHLQE